jgi:nucleoside phosphorylase
MTDFLVVYADDRELDIEPIRQRNTKTGAPRVAVLKTGVGKVRAATEVTNWLTATIRANRPRPVVVSAGTCASTEPGLLGKLLRPALAIDRDSTPSQLKAAGVDPQPHIELLEPEGWYVIGTGDGFLANAEHAKALAGKGVHLVDMETHAVAWAALRCYAGRIYSLRYVTDDATESAASDWKSRLSEARVTLTQAVLRLTEEAGHA